MGTESCLALPGYRETCPEVNCFAEPSREAAHNRWSREEQDMSVLQTVCFVTSRARRRRPFLLHDTKFP